MLQDQDPIRSPWEMFQPSIDLNHRIIFASYYINCI
jgi:hypothetical protein